MGENTQGNGVVLFDWRYHVVGDVVGGSGGAGGWMSLRCAVMIIGSWNWGARRLEGKGEDLVDGVKEEGW